jgi:hypothetical protein
LFKIGDITRFIKKNKSNPFSSSLPADTCSVNLDKFKSWGPCDVIKDLEDQWHRWVDVHLPFNAEHAREQDPFTCNILLLTFCVPNKNLIGERDSAGIVVV